MPDPAAVDPNAPAPPARVSGRAWFDSLLTVLVLAFACLAASFTARNSDLWMHLAAGRLVADGKFEFGTDPFAYTTEGVYWANHAWLADLGLYEGFRAIGGGGLVGLKAILVALTALVMLRAARGTGPSWLAAGVVLLAVLTMSPRFLVQPACLSLLLLALCHWLLQNGGRAHIAIPFVIAAWVNLDDWFVLGPLFIGFAALGQWLSRLSRPEPGPRMPRWLLPACLGACLLSPFHFYGLTLPLEWSPSVGDSEFARDPRFASIFARPWRLAPLGASGGYNLAAWAFWMLFTLGLASFAVNRWATLSWRGAVWLGFAVLACFHVRFVPFFAVVAGPIAALNLREAMPAGFLVRPGRVLVGVLGLMFCALAWPGWLQGFAARDRGLAWAVVPDPALEHTARVLKQWRDDGLLPADARTLATHPDLAHYLMWFAPEEQVYLDSRLTLFTRVASEYQAVSKSLRLIPSDGSASTGVFRDRNIACAVLYDPDPRRAATAIRAVAGDPERWVVVAVEGPVIVRPNDGVTSALTGRSFDPVRAAFGPPSIDGLPPAPVDGAALASDPDPVWLPGNRPRRAAWQGDAATAYLRLFEAGSPVDQSPALPLLAVRSARSAVAAGPADDDAWRTLAQAYLVLSRTSWEADVSRGFPFAGFLRQVQVAAALVQAVTAYPEDATGHEALAGLYRERGFFDLTFRHRQIQVRLIRRRGPLPGETREAFADRLAQWTKVLDAAEDEMQDSENRLAIQTHGLAGDPLARARAAVRLGLVGRAIDTLMTSHPDLYGTDGVRLLIELLVWTGRSAEARALLDRTELRRAKGGLGTYEIPGDRNPVHPWAYRLPAYDWFDLCAAAAAGNYVAAQAAAERLRTALQAQEEGSRRPVVPAAARLMASQAAAAALPQAGWGLPYAVHMQGQFADVFANLDFLAVERADLHTLEGLLHLERGAADAATEQFALAVRLYATGTGTARVRPGRALAERMLAALREAGR